MKTFSSAAVAQLADRLWKLRDKLWDIVEGIHNGFSQRVNLYHIL